MKAPKPETRSKWFPIERLVLSADDLKGIEFVELDDEDRAILARSEDPKLARLASKDPATFRDAARSFAAVACVEVEG